MSHPYNSNNNNTSDQVSSEHGTHTGRNSVMLSKDEVLDKFNNLILSFDNKCMDKSNFVPGMKMFIFRMKRDGLGCLLENDAESVLDPETLKMAGEFFLYFKKYFPDGFDSSNSLQILIDINAGIYDKTITSTVREILQEWFNLYYDGNVSAANYITKVKNLIAKTKNYHCEMSEYEMKRRIIASVNEHYPDFKNIILYQNSDKLNVDFEKIYEVIINLYEEKEWKPIKAKLVPGIKQYKEFKFEYGGTKYMLVNKRTISDEEIQMNSLTDSTTLKQQVLKDENFKNFAVDVLKFVTVSTSSRAKNEFVETFSKTLDNIHQLSRFIYEHKDKKTVAVSFEESKLRHYLSEWKLDLLRSHKNKDGYVQIGYDQLIALLRATVKSVSKQRQQKEEAARKLMEETISAAVTEHEQLVSDLAPFHTILQLNGSYLKQSSVIQAKAKDEWLKQPRDARKEGFDAWAQAWWCENKADAIMIEFDKLAKDSTLGAFLAKQNAFQE
ncbi:conserved putative CP/RdRp fusion protein [Saccharomycodes ludwigii]|uniref:conserved putative CP/RdRp fusion protein n=1 Tax=Saccharomycodes ludwigii TaxID=36035 RepID=UPI001E8D643A|nr:conserved putative CP/RdRp fusion protein [Saccharomycodes ludwigii]KAH3898643.1 conserved putative CP/RdRp fusion protein [Saccharomycodes ludwigii]